MTDPNEHDDRTWFRDAVAPVLDAHDAEDRWDALRDQVEDEPPLVVSLVPRRTHSVRRRLLALAAAAIVVVVGAVVLVAARDGGEAPTASPTTASTTAASPSPPSSTPPPATNPPPPSTKPPSTDTTTTTITSPPTVPPAELVEVPPVQSRISLASFGLDVRYLDRANPAVAEGAVVSQDPAPGVRVPEGSLVVVIMSGGGPVMAWEELSPEARSFTDSIPDYRRTEPIRRVPTDAGEAYKVDAWLFGPCAAVERARPTILDPSFDTTCY